MSDFLLKALIFAPPLIVAVVLHEMAHGLVALKLGDPTAKAMGRLSFNPLRHVDPMMTLILPGLLIMAGSPIVFGGAKPIPVNPGYFRNPRRGMMLVAVAGPLTNFALAAVCYLLLRTVPLLAAFGGGLIAYTAAAWFAYGILVNIVLGIFNLFPIPPLDGGRVAVGLLPRTLALPLARLEPYGLLIIFALLYFGVLGRVMEPLVRFALAGL